MGPDARLFRSWCVSAWHCNASPPVRNPDLTGNVRPTWPGKRTVLGGSPPSGDVHISVTWGDERGRERRAVPAAFGPCDHVYCVSRMLARPNAVMSSCWPRE